jgi:hypothetical protein
MRKAQKTEKLQKEGMLGKKTRLIIDIILGAAALTGPFIKVTIVAAASTLFSAIGTSLLIDRISLFWVRTPLFFETQLSRVICSIGVVSLGYAFFFLRESNRFIYSCLELGVAGGAGYSAARKLYHDHDTGSAILTLLGSVYIAVRAFDNFSKWREARAKKIIENNYAQQLLTDVTKPPSPPYEKLASQYNRSRFFKPGYKGRVIPISNIQL